MPVKAEDNFKYLLSPVFYQMFWNLLLIFMLYIFLIALVPRPACRPDPPQPPPSGTTIE